MLCIHFLQQLFVQFANNFSNERLNMKINDKTVKCHNNTANVIKTRPMAVLHRTKISGNY